MQNETLAAENMSLRVKKSKSYSLNVKIYGKKLGFQGFVRERKENE